MGRRKKVAKVPVESKKSVGSALPPVEEVFQCPACVNKAESKARFYSVKESVGVMQPKGVHRGVLQEYFCPVCGFIVKG